MRDDALAALPTAMGALTVDGPLLDPGGTWWLDLGVGEGIHVEWSPTRGFGLYVRQGGGYGGGPDQVFDDYDAVWTRLEAVLSAQPGGNDE